jgi:hypothetical protein
MIVRVEINQTLNRKISFFGMIKKIDNFFREVSKQKIEDSNY